MEVGDKEFVKMVRAIALEDHAKEVFREAVEFEKAYLRAHRSLWDRLFPWTITITRKKP